MMSELYRYDFEDDSKRERIEKVEEGIDKTTRISGCEKLDTGVFTTENGGSFKITSDGTITLSIDSEDVQDESEFNVSELTGLSFDLRPDDSQYRVITFGEINMDFGL